MIRPLDERTNIERQLIRLLCFEIARGTYRSGDPLPGAAALARDLLVNPRRVEAAYAALAGDGLVEVGGRDKYVVRQEAPAHARERVARYAGKDLASVREELRKAGFTEEETSAIFRLSLEDTEKGGTDAG